MTCEQAILLMNLALDDALEPRHAQALHQHLSQCENCRIRYKNYQLIADGLRSLPDEAPDHLHETIMGAIATEKRGKILPWRKALTAICAVAAMAVLVAVGVNSPLWLGRDSAKEAEPQAFGMTVGDMPPAGENTTMYHSYEGESDEAEFIEEAADHSADEASLITTAKNSYILSDLDAPTGYGAYLVAVGTDTLLPHIFEEYRLADGRLYAEIPLEDIETVTQQLNAAGIAVIEPVTNLPDIDAQSEICLVIVMTE